MLSLIEVKCPHCGAQGQITLPPLGSIIVGPCPQCEGMVAVFCGKVLALDNATMHEGTADEKRDHLTEVLCSFIADRVEQLFENSDVAQQFEALNHTQHHDEEPEETPSETDGHPHQESEQSKAPNKGAGISAEELDAFVNGALQMIDNPDYFKSVFGEK